jgi:hypothetical protein
MAGQRITLKPGSGISLTRAGNELTIAATIQGSDSETIDDRVAALLQAGSNITLTYDDVANTLTIASTASGVSNEVIDDRVAALLQAGSNITLTYDDTANTLTIASTASGGGGSSGVPNYLADYFTEFWDMGETAAGYLGAIAGTPLVKTGAILFSGGITGSAASMPGLTSAATGQSAMQVADNALLSARPGEPFCVTAAFYPTNVSGTHTIVSKAESDTVATTSEFWIHYLGPNTVRFVVFDNLNATKTVTATVTPAPAIAVNTWNVVTAWFDPFSRRIGLQVNGGTIVFASLPTNFAVRDTTAPFSIGAIATSRYYGLLGRIDSVGYSRKLPNSFILMALYNAGAGSALNLPVVADPVLAGLFQNAWIFPEAVGPWVDKLAAVAFTPVGVNGTAAARSVVGINEGRGVSVRSNTTSNPYRLEAPGSTFHPGAGSFCIAIAFKPNQIPSGTNSLVALFDPIQANFALKTFWLYYDVSGIYWQVYDSTNAYEIVVDSGGIVPTDEAWYIVTAWYNAATREANMQVNDLLMLPETGAADFAIRANPGAILATHCSLGFSSTSTAGGDATYGFIGFGKAVPTPAQRTAIYRGGRGPLV